MSGLGKISGHANATAHIIYGRDGLAPGIREIHLYATDDWLGGECLNTGLPIPPNPGDIRFFTNSWIGGPFPEAADVLRRVDYMVDQQGVMVICGVNNGAASAVPALLAGAYNVIAVGAMNGQSSGGYTTIEGAGRCKPDLVAPGGLTSFATPVVSAVTARLLETADHLSDAARARRPEVIRAVLMAGAVKPPHWHPQPGKPLDSHLGAGVVNLYNSYHILVAGPDPQNRPIPPRGWDLPDMMSGQRRTYTFTTSRPVTEASIILTWDRRIDGRTMPDAISGQVHWIDRPRLARFDLALFGVEPGTPQQQLLAQSDSPIDNVQHIYLRHLPAGTYRLEITRRDVFVEPWQAGLAWRFEPGK